MTAPLPPLLGPAQIRELAAQLGIHPTKKLGQNFVIDPNTVRKIVRLAQLQAGEHVLEVGPGLGSLTLALLQASAQVTAVEIDPVLAAQLPYTVAKYAPGAAFEVRHQDALTLTEITPAVTALVANLPYNVSVPVLLHVLATQPQLQHGLVMVQTEVAQRLAAPPGSKTYGIPSVKLAWYGTSELVAAVGRKVFWPEPNVDSALLYFNKYPPQAAAAAAKAAWLEELDTQQATAADAGTDSPNYHRAHSHFGEVVTAGFAMRRKTIKSNLSAYWPASAVESALKAAQIPPSIRAEDLDFLTWLALARSLPFLPK